MYSICNLPSIFSWQEFLTLFTLYCQFYLSNGPDKKERAKHNEHVEMRKGDNLTIVSTTLLIS